MSTTSVYGAARGTGPYFLCIENLPRQYTWQDLKDLIRQQATHGIWTDMAVRNGQTGGKGYARVQRVDEALKLYQYLTLTIIENRTLVVHLFDISSEPAVFKHCNCGNNPHSHPPSATISQLASGPGWQIFNATSPMAMPQAHPGAYQSPPMIAMSPSVANPMQRPQGTQGDIMNAMAHMQLNPQNPAHVAYFRQMWSAKQHQTQQAEYPQHAAQYPMYAANAMGTPINIQHGIVRTETRGVFVSGLNYKARMQDIEAYFRKAGEIVKLDLQKDPQTGKSKGNAIIQYAAAEEAQNAIDLFDKQMFMTMRLGVRKDKETTAINVPPLTNNKQPIRNSAEPTIVNGSQVRKDSVTARH